MIIMLVHLGIWWCLIRCLTHCVCQERVYEKGEVVIRTGEKLTGVFLVVGGSVSPIGKEGKAKLPYGRGQFFGALCILYPPIPI